MIIRNREKKLTDFLTQIANQELTTYEAMKIMDEENFEFEELVKAAGYGDPCD